MFIPVSVRGTGTYLPGEPVDNAEIVRRGRGLPEPAWIAGATGIRTRHVAGPDESVASMAEGAARKALEAAGLEVDQIRRIILVNSQGGDQPLPASGYFLASRLGARCGVTDIAGACHSWLHGFEIGARMVATGEGPVLVVASELFSRRVLDPADQRTFPIFGDGAAAAVLDSPGRGGGLLSVEHASHPGTTRAVYIPGPEDPERERGIYVRFGQDGRTMRDQGEAVLYPVVERALRAAGLAAPDYLVPHQPNAVWLARICAGLGLPPERAPMLVDRTGNLSSAMLPAGLDALFRRAEPPSPGQHLLLCAMGAGVGVAAMVLRVD